MRLPFDSRFPQILRLSVFLALLAGGLAIAGVQPVRAVSPNIVISQAYGGGGNAGAAYKTDFIELFTTGQFPAQSRTNLG